MTNEEAIKELREASDSEVRYGDTERHYNEVMKRVEAFDMAIKALEQQPKTGHWILLDECLNSGYYCSECHKKVIKEGWSNTVKKVKYCPNCGAKMEG